MSEKFNSYSCSKCGTPISNKIEVKGCGKCTNCNEFIDMRA